MTLGSLFSGCGGADLGLEQAGLECRWQCEKEQACIDILKKHWPNVPLYTDIVAFVKLLKHYLKTKNYEAIARLRTDIISGGSPCQDLSVAGQRAGMAGERSGLFRDMVRVCRILRPTTILWENVPGVLSSHGGKDFARVIGYFTGVVPAVPANGWGNAGFFKALPGMWHVSYRIVDSRYFGVAQRRRRVFLVASLRADCAAKVLFEPESLLGDPPSSRQARQYVAGTITRSSGVGGPSIERVETYIPQVARTLTAEGHDGMPTLTSNGDAHSGFRDADGLVATPIDLRNASRTKDRSEMNRQGTGVGKAGDPAHTVTGKHNAVAVSLRGREGAGTAEVGDEVSNALRASQGGGDKAHVLEPIPIQEIGRRTGKSTNDCQHGSGISDAGDPMYTLQATAQHGIGIEAGVRRLTPKECERLQGFPDDHTRWRADGTELSDSARYRMIGNAWTVSVAKWIGLRIAKYN